jgi:predicted lipid-binding transport protein (Tim44 family)
MRRFPKLLAVLLAAVIALAPALADARAGGGASMGSRGMRTYSAPPPTTTAPYSAAPMQRSLTPNAPNPSPGFGAPSYAPAYGYGNRSPFMTGFFGGLLGAGLAGLLFGHGPFWGIGGFGSVFGFLIQIVLLFLLVRWLLRLAFGRTFAFAGPGGFARMMPNGSVPSGGASGGGGTPPITVGRADYQQFEQLLQEVQAAWTAHDLRRLEAVCTPEMTSYFAEQLAEQASRGVRNLVTDVRLEKGDLAEAWSEGSREYATVAMRFSMLDVTRDAAGRVVDGSDTTRTVATELWTFLRASRGRWLLSAIQQAR